MIDRSIETATELAPIGAGVSVVVRIGVGAGRRMYPGLVRAWRGLGPGARPGQEQDETLNSDERGGAGTVWLGHRK